MPTNVMRSQFFTNTLLFSIKRRLSHHSVIASISVMETKLPLQKMNDIRYGIVINDNLLIIRFILF